MSIHLVVLTSIFVLVGLITLTVILRKLKFLDEEYGRVFSKLVIKVTLPALIFVTLTRTQILWNEVALAVIMLTASLICLVAGWWIARWLNLNRMQKGAVILVTGFGNSSLLGFALVAKVFPENAAAKTEAAILSGLGVQPALFTVGTLIAMHYGAQDNENVTPKSALLPYLKSPIFIALTCGIIFSTTVGSTDNEIFHSILDGLNVIASANTFLVTLTIGLLLNFSRMSDIFLVGLLVGIVKLMIMPILAWLPTLAWTLPDWQVQVLVLEAAMPSALLPVVLCNAHGCDAQLASRLVFATTVASAITMPIIFTWLV